MGELLGKQVQPRAIAALAYNAGWTDARALVTAVAVCLSESQGYDHAINVNTDGSRDRGIWQLNSIHAAITDEIAYDPARATVAAYSLWQANARSFSPWAAFNSGVYLNDGYLQRATLGVMNFLAEQMVIAANARKVRPNQPPTLSLVPLVSTSEFKYVREQLWAKRK